MTRRRQMPSGSDGEESCATRFPRTCWLKVGGIGLAIGAMNGLFGVGGGFMVVPALIVFLGFPASLAIGTSLSIIACISIGGVIGHLQFGRISWPLMAWVLAGSLGGMVVGVRAGAWLSPGTMGRVTAVITVSIAVSMIAVNLVKLWGSQV